MCYICNCFGWLLDLIQRIITFFLACWMACVVCIGLILASIAGIAYGYNYSMAEFLTFTRSDVTIYMRRGQFYDRPDIAGGGEMARRSGDGEGEKLGEIPEGIPVGIPEIPVLDENLGKEEIPPANAGIDYEGMKQANVDIKPSLSDAWQKAQDTRNYAERLVKYEYTPPRENAMFDEPVQEEPMMPEEPEPVIVEETPATEQQSTNPNLYYKLTTQPRYFTKMISILPNVVMSTTLIQNGNSQIVMRNFQPIEDMVPTRSSPSGFEEYANIDYQNELGRENLFEKADLIKPKDTNLVMPKSQYVFRGRPTQMVELKNRLDGKPNSITPIPMRHWSAAVRRPHKDITSGPEDSYEDSPFIKPA